MQGNTLTGRTWTLSGRGIQFNMLMTIGFGANGVAEVVVDEQSAAERGYFIGRKLPGAPTPVGLTKMALDSLVLGSHEDAAEVLAFLREECQHQVELFFDEQPAGDGNSMHFHFCFHDLGDALKFKLRYAEQLDAGCKEA